MQLWFRANICDQKRTMARSVSVKSATGVNSARLVSGLQQRTRRQNPACYILLTNNATCRQSLDQETISAKKHIYTYLHVSSVQSGLSVTAWDLDGVCKINTGSLSRCADVTCTTRDIETKTWIVYNNYHQACKPCKVDNIRYGTIFRRGCSAVAWFVYWPLHVDSATCVYTIRQDCPSLPPPPPNRT